MDSPAWGAFVSFCPGGEPLFEEARWFSRSDAISARYSSGSSNGAAL